MIITKSICQISSIMAKAETSKILAVVISSSGHLEFAVDDFDIAIGRVELDDLPLEPQGGHDPTVGADFKTVETPQVFFDQARGGHAVPIVYPRP